MSRRLASSLAWANAWRRRSSRRPAGRSVPRGESRSLKVYETARLDFAEACLVAQAEASGIGEIVSFDVSIDRIAGVKRHQP
jgi:predicted nucleic acid-binding protein